MFIENIQSSLDYVHQELTSTEERREKLIRGTRNIVILCGKSIISLHRNELEEAEKEIEEARVLLNEVRPYAKPDLERYIGDAEMEFVEACMLKSICNGSPLPLREELHVSAASYITGILDTIGEIKRLVYDKMRIANSGDVVRFFNLMQELQNAVYPLVVYDNIVPGLRRKLDISKMLTESVRAAVTENSRRELMLNAIRILEAKIKD